MAGTKFNTNNTIGIVILATFILFLVNVLTTKVDMPTIILGVGAFIAGLSAFLTFANHQKTRLYASFFFLISGIYAAFKFLSTTTTIFTITMLTLVAVGFLFLLSEKKPRRRISVSSSRRISKRKSSTKRRTTKRRKTTRRKKRR